MTHSGAASTKTSTSLTRAQIGFYALVMWPLCVGQIPLNFLVPFLAQVTGLNVAMLGFLMTIGRLIDVGFDVTIASLSDKFTTRMGRRKPWVLVGLPLFVMAGWVLFSPYPTMTMGRYAFGVFFFFLTWTIAFIPYLAQGTELSTDPIERSRINILQSFFMLAGLLMGNLLPLLIIDKRTFALREAIADGLARLNVTLFDGLVRLLHVAPASGAESYGRTMLVIVIATTIVTPLVYLGYALTVRDRSGVVAKAHGSVRDALRNRLFLRFCVGYALIMMAYIGRFGLFPFILAFRFGRADLFLVLLICQYVTSIAATPVWSWLFKRMERKHCIALAALIEASALAFIALMPTGNDGLLILSHVLIGLPGQTLLMASYLVASDSADYAKWKYGTESRAIHVSFVSLLVKFGNVAAAVFVWMAGLFGFNAKLKVQPDEIITMLNVLGLWIPTIMYLVGAILVATYPMTHKRQAAIQRRLDRREAAQAAGGLP